MCPFMKRELSKEMLQVHFTYVHEYMKVDRQNELPITYQNFIGFFANKPYSLKKIFQFALVG